MAPLVFIGYSNRDELEKNQLLSHLGVLEKSKLIDLWTDDCIPPGANRRRAISEAINRAKIAVLLITADLLNSNEANAQMLTQIQHRQQQGLIVYPLIAKPCAWELVDWLANTHVRPVNKQPIWRDEGHYADEHLADLTEEIGATVAKMSEQPSHVSLPFLIAAMTHREASELFKEDILVNNPDIAPSEAKRFEAFKAALLKHYTVDNILAQYTVQRANWKPLISPHKTIKKTVIEIVQAINQPWQNTQRLEPDFSLSTKLFHQHTRKQILKRLDRTVGVLLVDAISMFHPNLKLGLSSGIATHKHVAILVLSPLNTRRLKINRLIEETINQQMQTAVARFEQFEPLCQIAGIEDSRILKHRLFNLLPQTADLQAQLRLSDNVKRLEYGQGQETMDKGPVDFWSIGESL